MVTYNQEQYIAQAIESVLNQKTNFKFKILIGDDCSNDGTSDIVRSYAKRFPDVITPYIHENNLGGMGKNNFMFIYSKCQTKYATILEGDDYWDNENKLQVQVDFLERNPDFSIVFHKVKLLKDELLCDDFLNENTPEITTILDLAKGNYIRTLSAVFLNKLNGVLPDFYKENIAGDYILNMLNANHGKIKFLNKSMGVYRIHNSGVWTGNSKVKIQEEWLKLLSNLIAFFSFNDEVAKKLKYQRCEVLFSLSNSCAENKKLSEEYIAEAEATIPGITIELSKTQKRKKSGNFLLAKLMTKARKFWFKKK
jgi:glycosyltransferase involved in cell wall biosynthesis